MSSPNYSFYSKEELIELLQDKDHTLSYQQDTIKMLKDENRIIKKEFYKLADKLQIIESNFKEIKRILNNTNASSLNKINSIEEVFSHV